MGEVRQINHTRFTYFSMFSADENGRPLMSPIVKATFLLSKDGRIALPDEQAPLNLAGEVRGDPETGSYVYEPETAFIKLTTDVVLIGHARPDKPNSNFVDCGIRVGPVKKVARVFGDRFWVRKNGATSVTRAKPFDKIELSYENAFGGVDLSDKDAVNPKYETRNPVGRGYRAAPLQNGDKIALPNIEDPANLLRSVGQIAIPAGFGFTSPNWHPRVQLAGTYDASWQENRSPLLPLDFNRKYFNAASPGLTTAEYLRGNEPVTVVNASAEAKLNFSLPGMPPPECTIEMRDGRTFVVATNLDTVIVNTDDMKLFLLWRNCIPLRRGPHDVKTVTIHCAHTAAQTKAELR